MRLSTVVAILAVTMLPLVPASAQNQTAQQERMKACNTQAGSQKLSGDARRTFMSECLSGKTIAEQPGNPQQQRMKDCNATASQQKLSGDKRKEFMSTCLKGG